MNSLPLISSDNSSSFSGISFEDGGSDDEDGRSRSGNKQSTEAKYVISLHYVFFIPASSTSTLHVDVRAIVECTYQ
jgi:hypothetical protein